MNVLIAAAGRRTSLVRAFGDAAHLHGGRVFASDVDPLAPALFVGDEALRLPRSDDPTFIDELRDAVVRHEIRLVVPTIDTDLALLAASQSAFLALGCRIASSAESFVDITIDKYETGRSFAEAGIRVPASWLPPVSSMDELPALVIVKPRRGSASKDVYRTEHSELDSVLRLVHAPIVQEILEGPEITIDALLDFDGRPIHYVPRRRIRTLAGESVEGVTLDHDSEFEGWIEEVLDRCSNYGAAGPLTLQAFRTPDGPTLTEINPRFGGGFPLALAAGAAYPAWLLDLVDGRQVTPRLREYEPGLYMTRYYVEQFTRYPKW